MVMLKMCCNFWSARIMEWINIVFFTSLFNIHYVNKYVGYSIIQALFLFYQHKCDKKCYPLYQLKNK